MNEDTKKIRKSEKIALYYLEINGKDYYYSYTLIGDTLNELKNSYRLVDISKAKILLKKQMS